MQPAYVLGFGATGLGAIRSLGRRGIPVYGATWDAKDPAFWSRYLKARLCPDPVTQPEELTAFLLEESRRIGERPVLFTAGDAATLFVARHQEQLREGYLFHPLPAELMTALINKWRQYELAAAFGIAIPETFHPGSLAEAIQIRERLSYPAMIKPCYGHLWRKVYKGKGFRVQTPEELVERLREVFEQNLEVVVQSVIPGPARNLYSVCFYLGPEGKALALMGQRKIRQCPVDQGIGTLVESAEVFEQGELAVNFLARLGYRGPAEVEFKQDERDGQWKLIEFNVRLWEQNALAAACGLDFPYIQYLDLTGRPPAPQTGFRRGVRWLAFWEDAYAVRELRRRGQISLREWLASLRGVRVHGLFAWEDPGPCVRYYTRQGVLALWALGRKFGRVLGSVVGRIRRKLASAAALWERNPRRFWKGLTGSLERLVVYSARPEQVDAPENREGVVFRKLSDEELANLAAEDAELAKQMGRWEEVGANHAYGVFCEGRLAHVSWLIGWEEDRRLPVRLVRLEPGESEITTCYTVKRFRGRGLYPFAIRSLCQVARERGMQRIYMITGVKNHASRRGIEKGGLKPCGKVFRLVFPLFPHAEGWIWRGHRRRKSGRMES